MKWILATLAGLALLGGCAVSTPPQLGPVTRLGPAPKSLALRLSPVEEEAASPEAAQFGADLARALARHGITVSAAAPYRLDVALALRPDASGISPDASGTMAQQHWRSVPRRARLLDKCRARRLRVTLEGSLPNGAAAWRASGEFADCVPGAAARAALAEQFAAALAG
jgi:hypothetical protein